MARVSVIVPVYNVQDYLERCLNSLLSQTFTDLEFICINDGSTDNSLEILQKYAAMDNRFVIIDKVNEGVSVARNIGLEKASGEFIMFLDADDAYEYELCEKVVAKFDTENSDIVAWGHKDIIDGEFVRTCVKNVTRVQNSRTTKKLKHWVGLQVYIWEKAFKREFLMKNNIKFPVGIKNAEDMIFCVMTYLIGARYSIIPEGLYLYTIAREGASTNQNSECIKNDLKAFEYLYKTEEFQKQTRKIQILLANHFMGGAGWYFEKARTNVELCKKYLDDIEEFLMFVRDKFSFVERLQIKNYRKLKMLVLNAKIRGIR